MDYRPFPDGDLQGRAGHLPSRDLQAHASMASSSAPWTLALDS